MPEVPSNGTMKGSSHGRSGLRRFDPHATDSGQDDPSDGHGKRTDTSTRLERYRIGQVRLFETTPVRLERRTWHQRPMGGGSCTEAFAF